MVMCEYAKIDKGVFYSPPITPVAGEGTGALDEAISTPGPVAKLQRAPEATGLAKCPRGRGREQRSKGHHR